MKYDRPLIIKRDNKIKRYALKHPELSQQEIANKYKMSRSNISRILLKGD
jgi:transcriptional regulator